MFANIWTQLYRLRIDVDWRRIGTVIGRTGTLLGNLLVYAYVTMIGGFFVIIHWVDLRRTDVEVMRNAAKYASEHNTTLYPLVLERDLSLTLLAAGLFAVFVGLSGIKKVWKRDRHVFS